MKCQVCGGLLKTIDSRPLARVEHTITRRRKECKHCGNRTTTFEGDAANLVLLFKPTIAADLVDKLLDTSV